MNVSWLGGFGDSGGVLGGTGWEDSGTMYSGTRAARPRSALVVSYRGFSSARSISDCMIFVRSPTFAHKSLF